MRRLAAVLLAAAVATPAAAAERQWGVGSFSRLRVDGAFEVRIANGAPRARASSPDARLLERVALSTNGDTMTIRVAPGEQGGSDGAPIVVTLSTPQLAGVTVLGGGRVMAEDMRAPRLDLAVTGSGTLAASGVAADQLVATTVGSGAITLSGKAQRARLVANGPGLLDAAALTANELAVTVDGAGEARARARYSAQVRATGAARVSVEGEAKCRITAVPGAAVTCAAGTLGG